MITIEEAISKICTSELTLPIVEKEISNSLMYYLAEDIYSPINMPPFSQSAMDGYAICGSGASFDLIGEIKAGDTQQHKLKEGTAFRIFTGAMIPENTTAIAKQEIVEREANRIFLQENVAEGTSIRAKGEEVKKGRLLIQAHTKINAAAIGLMSGVGIEKVKVFKKPRINVVVTGNELTKLGEDLPLGKIYESNSYALLAALKTYGFNSKTTAVADDYQKTKSEINIAIAQSDVLIMTGGISVGDYDFVGKALAEIGVTEKFYKVKQKPGKPIYYGEYKNTKIFALPGNPAAALTCFYVYVLPSIRKMMGSQNPQLETRKAQMTHAYQKKGNRAHLLKALVKDNQVSIHKGQSSAMLSSFVNANCLLYLKENTKEVEEGEEVSILLIP